MKLSILVPVHDEAATLDRALDRLAAVDYPCPIELVVVDDGSSDESARIIARFADRLAPAPAAAAAKPFHDRPEGWEPEGRVELVTERHPVNRGKGAAIRTAAGLASGDMMTICDADLEYDPADIPRMLEPVLRGETEVVFGTRTFGSHTSYSFWYVLGNKGVTTFANVAFNCYISDLETCFKLMPLSLYRELEVRSAGFGMEAEITGKLLGRGIRPYEVPISYRARTREQGKKLTWRDGVEALWILTRIRLRGPR